MAESDATPPHLQDGLLSVVMPVHNAAPYLDAAIGSVLNQTYRDFEFVILDDGSTDGSTEKLREWAAKDERIRLHRLESNSGPAESSNLVVRRARGELIARMDADDVSLPDRLEQQVELLKRRPEVGLVGTLCDVIDKDGRIVRTRDLWRLTRRSWFAPFPHGSIMYRRELFNLAGGYRPQCVYWEDQDMFLRMSSRTRVVTIPRSLYRHRQSPVSTRLVSRTAQVEQAVDLMYRCIDALIDSESYDAVLEKGTRSDTVDPRVFVSLGSLQLWAGQRPRYFRRLLKHGELRLNFRSVSALAWTLWASLSPVTLRLLMRGLSSLRNASAKSDTKDAVDWTIPKPLRSKDAVGPDEPVMPVQSDRS